MGEVVIAICQTTGKGPCPTCGGQATAIRGPLFFLADGRGPLCSVCSCRLAPRWALAMIVYRSLLAAMATGDMPLPVGS